VINGISRDIAWQGWRISWEIDAKSRSEKKERDELRVGIACAHQGTGWEARRARGGKAGTTREARDTLSLDRPGVDDASQKPPHCYDRQIEKTSVERDANSLRESMIVFRGDLVTQISYHEKRVYKHLRERVNVKGGRYERETHMHWESVKLREHQARPFKVIRVLVEKSKDK
jgi:hypothetical protein